MPDMNENAETQQEYFGRANVGRMNIEEREKTILLQQLSDREKRIIELERKLEQTEKDLTDYQFNYPKIKDLEKENAELKAHHKKDEWQFVSEKGTPQKEGHYLVCLRNKDRDIFDCWIYYDKDVGWYSMKVRMKDIYAWKEIIFPELLKGE